MNKSTEDIKRDIRVGMKLDAEGHRLLIKKLESVKRSLEKTVAREKSKREERVDALNEYKTEQEIQDAYGYGDINDEERRQLLDALETGERYVEDTQTKTSSALYLLRLFMHNLEGQASSLEFECLSPEEQERRREAAGHIRERIDARRAGVVHSACVTAEK